MEITPRQKLEAYSNPAMHRITVPHDGMTTEEIRRMQLDDWKHNHPFARLNCEVRDKKGEIS